MEAICHGPFDTAVAIPYNKISREASTFYAALSPTQLPNPEPQNLVLYTPQYETAQPAHTQAIFPSAPKSAIFSPSEQSQYAAALRFASSQVGEEPSAYKTGPVQFGAGATSFDAASAAAAASRSQPQPQPRLQPQARSGASQGLLDQLARDYALPQNSAPPLHDISFGYY
ncbi:hypothetical protein QAD02_010454 [Eretmocerus hayati]|uniref:Uncharacterized protein n=1 Tax=Eretmocerus hayati TaxID=131215 RepID=A0ACC2NUX9_9HYME|nr:hypothetical protein QAD02_010454 [Eretmocerus hayati]